MNGGNQLASISSTVRTSVLIIGAGPVGLSLAIELGSRGVSCIVLERNMRVGQAPRAKTTHTRTREHLRRWGIAGELAAASPLGIDYPSDVTFVTRLAGYRLAQFKDAFHCAPARNPLYSEHAQWIPQYTLEETLKTHVQQLSSVDIRFNAEFLNASQGNHLVTSQFRDVDRDSTITVESDFMVGADGARSAVRALIGARMEGAYGLSRNYNFVFRAPGLAQAHRHGPAIMYWQVNADLPSLIGPMDSGDTWFFMPTRVPDGLIFSKTDAASAISRSTGIDLPYEVVHSDEWVASQLIADRYRDRRIFLAGDACHLHPPFGGYGMNMGVADGVDLGWKLAAVIQGWGGPALLDSYALERRPTHEAVIAEAVASHAALADSFWQEGLEAATEAGARMRSVVGSRIAATKAREFHNLACVLGYCYDNSPVIIQDGSPPTPRNSDVYTPSSRPGCVAPHAWLGDDTSLFDAFGPGYTLLSQHGTPHGSVRSAVADAKAAGIPLRTVHLPDSVASSLYPAALTLIRPDQHVAWRGEKWDGAAILRRVSGQSEIGVIA